MPDKTRAETSYPHVAHWSQDYLWIEIGRGDSSQSMVRALDIGGMTWEGILRYSAT